MLRLEVAYRNDSHVLALVPVGMNCAGGGDAARAAALGGDVQTLEWTRDAYSPSPYHNGRSLHDAGHWQGVVNGCDPGIFAWSLDSVAGLSAAQGGHPTERAAQLACEAFLWRNGILPLPEWTKHGRHLECHRIGDLTYRAEVSLWRGLGRLTWLHIGLGPHAMAACELHLRGQWETVEAAKRRAEHLLRAEIAARLDEQAAKETP